ncbi:MAG: hypothetical protein OEV21_03935 [Thermoplasmata archaeon]|nr:hypothetical protein [Thermoplasmata archaeon]
MADSGSSGGTKKQTDQDREKTLEELKALRQKRLDSGKSTQSPSFKTDSKPAIAPQKNSTNLKSVGLDISQAREQDDEAAITAIRASRMQAEAYHDITKLRKQANLHEHKSAKFLTKSKSYDTKAQRAITRAIQNRKKAVSCRENIKDYETRMKDLQGEMKSAATEDTGRSPEKVSLSIAKQDKKIASLQEKAMKYEAKAAMLNEKAAMYKTKSAFNLEQSKIHNAEVKNFTKRADKLEQLSGQD